MRTAALLFAITEIFPPDLFIHGIVPATPDSWRVHHRHPPTSADNDTYQHWLAAFI